MHCDAHKQLVFHCADIALLYLILLQRFNLINGDLSSLDPGLNA